MSEGTDVERWLRAGDLESKDLPLGWLRAPVTLNRSIVVSRCKRACQFGRATQWGAMLVFRLFKKTPCDLTEASVWVI